MKKIIVFYDLSDIAIARKVAQTINATGFLSWLADDDSRTDWHSEVEELVASQECVGAVVVWSNAANKNSVVRDEAREIVKGSKPLLGLFLGDVNEAPFGLRDGPRHQLVIGAGGGLDEQLTEKIRTVFGAAGSHERALTLNNKKLLAPSMVLSVSSFETQIEPEATLDLLSKVNPTAVLVSAYDLLRPKGKTKASRTKPKISSVSSIKSLRDSGSVVFLDSGNYEAMRYKDPDWKRSNRRLQEAQERIEVDLAFTHDSFPKETTFEKANAQSRIDVIASEYQRDHSLVSCAVAPIIHAPRLSGMRYRYDLLPAICCGVVRAVDPPMIAVAERELGDGLMERVRTIAKIRKALTDQGSTTFLHVLGTGNPITMAFLSMAGADFFDGLEWCRTAIDGQRWRLYHFQQWDIFASQHGLIERPELAQLVKDQSGAVPWITKATLHNMAFFMQASETIRTHDRDDEYEQLFTYKELGNEYQIANKLIEECQ